MWLDVFETPNPPFSEALVEQVERILGVRLPLSYVNLMRERNGGYLEPRLLRVGVTLPEKFKGYISHGHLGVASIAGLNTAPDTSGSLTQSSYMIDEWDLPCGLVLLDGDGHTWIALDYRETNEAPAVVFVLAGQSECLKLADNFGEFLQKLVPYEDVYDLDGNLRNQY